MADAARPTHLRQVRSDDPSLSPEANRLLTEELRAAIGRDAVEVPDDRPDSAHQAHATHGGPLTALEANKVAIAIALFAALVIGAIVALATGSWWVLVGALALHALGTLVVASTAIEATAQPEHVAPDVAARLRDEGVADPDGLFNQLIEEFAGGGAERGAAEVVSTGANELTVRPEDDPGKATIEQRTAMTPSGRASVPAGDDSVIAAMPWAVVLGTMAIGLVAAIVEGGLLWVAAAVIWGSGVAWYLLQRQLDSAAEQRAGEAGRPVEGAGPGRPPGDRRTGIRTRLAPTVLLIVGGVAAFAVIAGLLVDRL